MPACVGRLLLLTLAVLVAAASPALARPKVAIEAFKPTQIEIGEAAVQDRLARWRRKADEKGLSMKEYAETVLRPRYSKLVVPAIRDPDGAYRNTDAHHRMTALRRVSAETGVRFEVKVKVLRDYRGMSFDDYAADLVDNLRVGYFGDASRLSPSERVRALPDSYDQMQDNPLRSAVGTIFDRVELESDDLADYVEFHVGRKLVERGLTHKLRRRGVARLGTRGLPGHLATDPRALEVIQDAIFDDPEIVALLERSPRSPKRAKRVREGIGRALDRHRAARRVRPAGPQRAVRARAGAGQRWRVKLERTGKPRIATVRGARARTLLDASRARARSGRAHHEPAIRPTGKPRRPAPARARPRR